ncbi:MAG: glucose-1-phosphate cytidylyltransferase [Gaiellaceae bacterium]
MKVVLFCGGLGLRMRESSERVPKPMVPIGGRPILWHVMKYFAHHGHTEFVLCLGYKAEAIKDYFLNYNEALSNDFVLSDSGRKVELLRHDIQDWEITFVDTGLHTSIGQRLKAVQPHLAGEEMFLANYGDVVTDAPLPALVANLRERGMVASFLCVKPGYTFHIVSAGKDGLVSALQDTTRSDLWINGGYFVFRKEIFDYIHDRDDLVEQPFQRLIEERQLLAHKYEGFWAPMDTLKDQQKLEALLENGNGPWRVWEDAGIPDGVRDGVRAPR